MCRRYIDKITWHPMLTLIMNNNNLMTSKNTFRIFGRYIILLTAGLALTLTVSCERSDAVIQFDPVSNSNIVFIGNTFAERLQHNNYFETLLYRSFPDRHLKVRNLAWSADEINLRPRPLNFGTLDEHLHQQKADVIFAFFGLNEAFKGPDSLENF